MKKDEPVAQPQGGVFQSSQNSITLAKEMVKSLEAERRRRRRSWPRRTSQLVNTMKQELTEALAALDRGKKIVAAFVEQGTSGLARIKEAGTAKMTEIKAHMAKIRQILDQKEQVALDSISANMQQRVKQLDTEMLAYNKVGPEIQDLIDGAKMALQGCTRDPQAL